MAPELDHVGAIVKDLESGAARWERLGFLLTPASQQSGRMPGSGEVGKWATANRCAIFESGYLELIGVLAAEAARFNPWTTFLERFEGLHLLALRVPDANAAHADLRTRLSAIHDPVQRERRLDVDGRERVMRFRNVFTNDDGFPEGRYIFIEHQTPEYVWQPRYQAHPNGALALEAALLCADDLEAQAARLEALVARPPVTRGEARCFDGLARGRIELYAPEHFQARYGWRPPRLPCFAGAEVRFADRAAAAALMARNGAGVERRGEEWYVSPAFTNGFVLRMAQ